MEDVLLAVAEDMAHAAPPPASRAERAAEFVRRRHAIRQASIDSSRHAFFPRGLVLVIATLILLVAFVLSRTHSVVLRAEELLEQAVLQERARPADETPRVRMRWLPNVSLGANDRPPAEYGTASSGPRLLSAGDASGHALGNASDSASDSALDDASANDATIRLLRAHRLDPARLLSIQQLQRWRAGLAHKVDRVTLTGDMNWLLRTTTYESALRQAEIEFRRETFEVVRATLVFDGVGRLQVEATEQRTRQARRTMDARAAVPVLASASAAAPPIVDTLQLAELDVRLLLRESEMDLDGPVRVSRVGDELRVVLASTLEGRAVEARLEAVSPRVRVAWLPVAAESSTLAAASDDLAPVSASSPVRPWIVRWQQDSFTSSPEERTGFSARLEWTTFRAMRRLTLLNGLARRYSAGEVERMPPAAQVRFQRLLVLQYRALNRDLQQISERLATLGFSSLVSAQLACDPQASERAWRTRSARALALALVLRRSIHQLVTQESSPADRSGDDDPARIDREFSALWDAVNSTRMCGD